MARLARIVAPGIAHHATQRGNRRGDVFEGDLDRREYLEVFSAYRVVRPQKTGRKRKTPEEHTATLINE